MNPDRQPTDAEILAYLNETLAVQRSAALERQLRDSPELQKRAAELARFQETQGHSIGAIWRRHRLSCLSRVQLGSYLLGICPPDLSDYIEFHLNRIECRYCLANLEDLKSSQTTEEGQQQRQKRYFESSAGLFRSQRPE